MWVLTWATKLKLNLLLLLSQEMNSNQLNLSTNVCHTQDANNEKAAQVPYLRTRVRGPTRAGKSQQHQRERQALSKNCLLPL